MGFTNNLQNFNTLKTFCLTQSSFEMLFDNQRGKTRKDFNFHVFYLQAAQYILYTNGLK